MKPRLQPSKRQLADFEILLSLGPRLKDASRLVANCEKTTLAPNILADLLIELLPLWTEVERVCLFRQVMGMRGLMLQGGYSASEVVEGVTEGITREGWEPNQIDAWRLDVVPQLHDLLNSRIVRVTSKAATLAYDYAYLLKNVRIVTDVRPVFSPDATDIEGAVVSHVLRLDYNGSNVDHTLSVVLDHRDVQMLMAACERALKKATAISERLASGKSIPSHITGDDDVREIAK